MYFQFWNINCKIWIGLKHKLNTVFFFESHKCHNFYTSFWSDLYLNSCKIKTSFSLKKVTLNTSCFQSDLSFENYISALLNFIRSVNFSVSSYKNNEFVWLLIQRVARVSCIGRDHPHWFLMHTLSCRSWQEKRGLSIVELQGGKSLCCYVFLVITVTERRLCHLCLQVVAEWGWTEAAGGGVRHGPGAEPV